MVEDMPRCDNRVLSVSAFCDPASLPHRRRQVEDVEKKLPPKVSVVVKVPMSAVQSSIYEWVRTTGTLRLDPLDPRFIKMQRHKMAYASLANRMTELRKVVNHPLLSYPSQAYEENMMGENIVRSCGKLWVLDRILVKVWKTGHRVLLFSTMTKLLDNLELYLNWRLIDGQQMKFRRIDGQTTLEEREDAIKAFNAPDSDIFIFLLSIKAAGRGLNLQTSDTVVIYDPDPNPKNEEQAIARSHR